MDDSDTPDSPEPAPTPGTLTRAVAVRARHNGWTPDKQHDFIAALAETGCVTEAAAALALRPAPTGLTLPYNKPTAGGVGGPRGKFGPAGLSPPFAFLATEYPS